MGLGFCRRPMRGQQVHPEVLSAFVLERMKQDAEQRLGPVREVVITVPAFFDELRRKATQDAGRLAGLEVLDIINEPTAAALAFGFQQGFMDRSASGGSPHRVLVYDLGGGTFDVTILEISGNTFRTLATDGDVCLGGKDFDERLVNHLADQFVTAHGVDPRSDPQDAMQLWRDAEDAKHTLSERNKTTVVCFHGGIRMRIEVTRAEFEELTRDLLERTRTTSSLVMQQAGLGWKQIDRVLLVGGSSRMPMVTQMLSQLTDRQPDRSASPDESVAHGAALYAGMLAGQHTTAAERQFRLVNVNSHSLGVAGADPRTGRRVNVILIPKNTPLPHHAAKTFKTSRENLRTIDVSIVEGESKDPDHCIALGKCVVRDLEPGLPKGSDVVVEFHYDANGRISVLGRVPRTRQSAHVQILREKQYDLEDLQSWRDRLCGRVPASRDATFAKGPSERASGSSADTVHDPGDERARLVQLLDSSYMKIGRLAAKIKVPAALASSHQSASLAAKSYRHTRATLEQAEKNQQAATGRTEAMHAMTEVSQARMAVKQAEIKASFSLLVLGRECVQANYVPPGAEREFEEVQRLQTQLHSDSI
jgi:molecular chaperone DnaK